MEFGGKLDLGSDFVVVCVEGAIRDLHAESVLAGVDGLVLILDIRVYVTEEDLIIFWVK